MKVLILGSGQLAQMMALASVPLNISLKAYDVGSNEIVHPISKAKFNQDLDSAIAESDVITAEFEHIPHPILDKCEASGKLKPSAQAIKIGGDRRLEKSMLESANVKSADYQIVVSKDDYLAAIEKLGLPLVLKSALSGYDGKGQFRLKKDLDTETVWGQIANFLATSSERQAIVAEQFIPFDSEVSMVGARDAQGNINVYPITENIHVDGVLSVSLALSQRSAEHKQAQSMFEAIAHQLNYVGVLAIEFFQKGNELLVNEIAPRVHNSGHWSQQGAHCSQFENHIRAVCDLPLGDTALQKPTCMINILGIDKVDERLLEIPGLSMHWYGKSKRPGRKMGHINISGQNTEQLKEKLRDVTVLLDAKDFPALENAIALL